MFSMQLSLKQKSFRSCRNEERERHGGDWAVTRSMPELLRPEMRRRQVTTGVWQEPGCQYWRPNAVFTMCTQTTAHVPKSRPPTSEHSDISGGP